MFAEAATTSSLNFEFPCVDFDQRLAAIRAHDALYVLKQVRDKAHTSWNTILSSVDPEVKQESYMTLLANVLADTPVMPIDGILKPFQDCCLTHDALEAAKIVYFEIEVSFGRQEPSHKLKARNPMQMLGAD